MLNASCLINDSLDEVADGRELVVNEMAGTDAVGGNKYFRMQARTKQVDGDHRRTADFASLIERLADQHLATLERRVAMTANGVADDLGGDHGGTVISYLLLVISIPSDNSQILDEDAAADAGEGFGGGNAFASSGGDRVGQVTFAAEA